jgi:hypothetical protein
MVAEMRDRTLFIIALSLPVYLCLGLLPAFLFAFVLAMGAR